MKTKEFIKKVKELGFEVECGLGEKGELIEIWIGDSEEDFVVIWPNFTFAISTIEYGFVDLKDPLPLEELYKLCFEYASTPVKDREEEKKFYMKHKWLNLNTHNYLHLDVDDGSCMLDDNEEFSFTKTKLTEKEIEEIKEKFDTDLADFELVEVEE